MKLNFRKHFEKELRPMLKSEDVLIDLAEKEIEKNNIAESLLYVEGVLLINRNNKRANKLYRAIHDKYGKI